MSDPIPEINLSIRISKELAEDVGRAVRELANVHNELSYLIQKCESMRWNVDRAGVMLKDYWPKHQKDIPDRWLTDLAVKELDNT